MNIISELVFFTLSGSAFQWLTTLVLKKFFLISVSAVALLYVVIGLIHHVKVVILVVWFGFVKIAKVKHSFAPDIRLFFYIRSAEYPIFSIMYIESGQKLAGYISGKIWNPK